MPIDIENFPDPIPDVDVTVSRSSRAITLTPRTKEGIPNPFQSKTQRSFISSFFTLFGWGVNAMKAFGVLFTILWFWTLTKIDAEFPSKVLFGVFGAVFMAIWLAIVTFIGKSVALPRKMIALAAPAWQLELTQDLWQITRRQDDQIQERAYDAMSLTNIRYEEDHVIADEFDYDSGQWIQIQLAGPLDTTTGKWLASQLA